MGSTSATGAVTTLSVTASTITDLFSATLREAHAETGHLTAQTLHDRWYELPLQEFAEAFVARCKPRTHLPLSARRAMPNQVVFFLHRWYDLLVENPVINPDRLLAAEEVASRLTWDLSRVAEVGYLYAHEQASRTHWQARREDDGRVTTGTTPSGRRKRASVDDLLDEDYWTAQRAASDAQSTVRLAVGGGIHRRRARERRLALGLSVHDVQRLMAYAAGGPHRPFPLGFGLTGWETDGRTDEQGRGVHPRDFAFHWPYLARALDLDPNLDDGPLVPSVTAPKE